MSTAQARQALLTKLMDAKPLDEPTAFVLLWTYFDHVGLSEVENNFYLGSFDPDKVEPIPARTDDPTYDADRVRAALAKKKHQNDFDSTAVAWLKGIDRLLATQRGTFEAQAIEGYDGRQYRVRALNNYIARYFSGEREIDSVATENDAPGDGSNRAMVGNRKRSLSLSAYCRKFRVIPTEVKGIRIDPTSKWSNPYIHDRLRNAARETLRFISWPLQCDLSATRWEANGNDDESTGKFVRVSVVADVGARHKELQDALDAARRERAAVLVLPELSTASVDLPAVQALLAANGSDDFPILTVVGLEHQRGDEHDINEAVVLGPDGEIVHRHLKLTRYPADDGSKEGIRTGTSLQVLESPIGNLAVVICLDLFNETTEAVIAASHANVLLVPSLSSKTSAHVTAAYRYLNLNLAATIVCNRWFRKPEEANGHDRGREETFALLPGKTMDGKTLLAKFPAGGEYLLSAVE